MLKRGQYVDISLGTCSFYLTTEESSNHLLIICPSIIVLRGHILQNFTKKKVLSLVLQCTILIDGIKFCAWKWILVHHPLSFSARFTFGTHNCQNDCRKKFNEVQVVKFVIDGICVPLVLIYEYRFYLKKTLLDKYLKAIRIVENYKCTFYSRYLCVYIFIADH